MIFIFSSLLSDMLNKVKMMNSSVMIIALAAMLLLLLSGVSYSQKRPVTPYGDFCPRCTKYGNCEKTMSHEDAKRAMIEYYHKKGLGVELEKKRGRFIRAKVKKKSQVIDVIIFDRRTGRIRSIY